MARCKHLHVRMDDPPSLTGVYTTTIGSTCIDCGKRPRKKYAAAFDEHLYKDWQARNKVSWKSRVPDGSHGISAVW